MSGEVWIGLAALVVNALVLAVGYGVLKGTVSALSARVNALESEMTALGELKVTVAEVKTTMTFLLEQFKDLNSSIRWMRDPAQYDAERPAPRPRTRRQP